MRNPDDRLIARGLDWKVRQQSAEAPRDPDRVGQPAQRQPAPSAGAQSGGCRQRMQTGTGYVVDSRQVNHQPGVPPVNGLGDGGVNPHG